MGNDVAVEDQRCRYLLHPGAFELIGSPALRDTHLCDRAHDRTRNPCAYAGFRAEIVEDA